jgi:hypothetical protein
VGVGQDEHTAMEKFDSGSGPVHVKFLGLYGRIIRRILGIVNGSVSLDGR